MFKGKWRKLFGKLAVIGLCLGVVAGCGASTSSSDTTTANNTAGQSGETSESKPSTITIGGVLPLTGQGAMYGEMGRNGMELAAEEINANGGVQGIQIKVQFEDHQANAAQGLSALKSLADIHKVPYSLVSYSNVIPGQLPIADEKGITLMNAFAQDQTLAGKSEYLFHDIPLTGMELEALCQYLANEENIERVAIIYDEAAAGENMVAVAKEVLGRLGVEIVEIQSGPLGSTDWQSQLIKIKQADPQVIMLGTYGEDVIYIMKQARQLGINVPFAGTTYSMIPDVYNEPGAEGMFFTSLQLEPSGDFVEAYKAKYNTDPTIYSITSYNAVKIFAQALDHVLSNNQPINGDTIRDAINAIKTFDTGASTVTFREDGTSVAPVVLSKLVNGQGQEIKVVNVEG